jgi:hypothetical protein
MKEIFPQRGDREKTTGFFPQEGWKPLLSGVWGKKGDGDEKIIA